MSYYGRNNNSLLIGLATGTLIGSIVYTFYSKKKNEEEEDRSKGIDFNGVPEHWEHHETTDKYDDEDRPKDQVGDGYGKDLPYAELKL